MAESGSLIKQVKQELESIFRHMLPGIAVLIAASLAHPHWLDSYDFGNVWHLAVLAAIAVAAGNIWYVFHRFSVHQLIDYLTYARTKRMRVGYSNWLTNHIRRSFSVSQEEFRALKNYIHLRSAQIIFLFLCSEIALVFTIGADEKTFFHDHARWIWLVAGGGILCAINQQVLGFKIDLHVIENCAFQEEAKANVAGSSGV